MDKTMMSRRDALATAMIGGTAIMAPVSAVAQAHGSSAAEPTAPIVPVMPEISRYIAEAQTAPVPEPVRELARLHILDNFASIVACRDLEASKLGRAYAAAHGSGNVPIFNTSERSGLVDAVFATAMAGHAAEINDFIPSALVQPGASVVPTAMLLGQARKRSGKRVMNAVIAGYELCGRMPKTLGTSNLAKAGLANHGVGPVFGTAAAAASLIGMDASAVRHVLSYCAQQASGSWQWLLDVRHVEKAFVFAAMGARNGLQAALMVETGFTGLDNCLDAEGSWLRSPAFTGGDANPGYLVEGLGTRFELLLSAYKRYPTGGPTQPSMQALLSMREKVKPEEVESIRIEMPGRWDAFKSANMPALNLPYLASLIMLDGKLDFVSAQSLDRMHNDAAIRAFSQKVDVVHDKAQEAAKGQPRNTSARVIINRRGKPPLTEFVPYVRGFPEHPMSRADVEAKAHELIDPVLGAKVTKELIQRTQGLDDEPNVDALVALVTR